MRERAVRVVQEYLRKYPSLWTAIETIVPQITCVAQTLNEWVKRAEDYTGLGDSITTSETQRVKKLERKVKAKRRATEN